MIRKLVIVLYAYMATLSCGMQASSEDKSFTISVYLSSRDGRKLVLHDIKSDMPVYELKQKIQNQWHDTIVSKERILLFGAPDK